MVRHDSLSNNDMHVQVPAPILNPCSHHKIITVFILLFDWFTFPLIPQMSDFSMKIILKQDSLLFLVFFMVENTQLLLKQLAELTIMSQFIIVTAKYIFIFSQFLDNIYVLPLLATVSHWITSSATFGSQLWSPQPDYCECWEQN